MSTLTPPASWATAIRIDAPDSCTQIRRPLFVWDCGSCKNLSVIFQLWKSLINLEVDHQALVRRTSLRSRLTFVCRLRLTFAALVRCLAPLGLATLGLVTLVLVTLILGRLVLAFLVRCLAPLLLLPLAWLGLGSE